MVQRDLAGVPLTNAQMALLGNAAINACDVVNGQHLGYIPDPSECRYDPTQDPSVICAANGGTNTTVNCVTPLQAQSMNKMWFGQTRDGTAPPPSVDNSWSVHIGRGNHLWYGLARGTNMSWRWPAYEPVHHRDRPGGAGIAGSDACDAVVQ